MDLAARRQLPTVRLRRLAAELRTLREAAGLKLQAVADRTAINAATLYRIEGAKTRPQRRTLLSLLDVYGVTDQAKRDELIELAKQSAQLGWLHAYENELPELYTTYIGFESEARSVRNYESLFVPGLLQTAQYARAAITEAGPPIANPDEITHRVEVRLQRQAVLNKKSPLRLWTIMDEAAIYRLVGGPEVMAAQLRHLLFAGQAAHITVQVVPFSAGAHAGMAGGFVVMDFADPADPDLVYIDSMAGEIFLEREPDVRRYTGIFDQLRASALSPPDSLRLIEARAETIEKGGTG
jgi:transcriptional regulator with XRE-family HTH domain